MNFVVGGFIVSLLQRGSDRVLSPPSGNAHTVFACGGLRNVVNRILAPRRMYRFLSSDEIKVVLPCQAGKNTFNVASVMLALVASAYKHVPYVRIDRGMDTWFECLRHP